MPITNQFDFIAPSLIQVDREQRQRQASMDIGDLIHTIRVNGILHPLIVDRSHNLLTGERRLLTAKFLDLPLVPVRYADELSPIERQILELDENIKRSDLDWKDKSQAILRVHKLYLAEHGDEWSANKTADMLGITQQWTNRHIALALAMSEGDKNILAADSMANAETILKRRTQRMMGETMNRILEMETDDEEAHHTEVPDVLEQAAAGALEDQLAEALNPSPQSGPVARSIPPVVPAVSRPAPYSITQADAHEFFKTERTTKFNFLHLDFPYGVKLNGQAHQSNFEGGGYDSDPDIYWALCNSLLVNWDKVMYPSSHVMCWISMQFYTETIELFESRVPGLKVNRTPLIWHKTDNRGILADPLRGPRNIYEACLIMSTGDRHIVKPVSNVYGAPTAKSDSIHTNEKPEPMLRHFMSMFVDHHSRVLDPTTGSGSSIRAAESLGAEAALGLEHNADFATRAADALIRARGLRELSAAIDRAASSPIDTSEEA